MFGRVSWLVGWLAGRLAGWLAGWLLNYPKIFQVKTSVCCPKELLASSPGWPAGRLPGESSYHKNVIYITLADTYQLM